jgi:hypothetical protein
MTGFFFLYISHVKLESVYRHPLPLKTQSGGNQPRVKRDFCPKITFGFAVPFCSNFELKSIYVIRELENYFDKNQKSTVKSRRIER